MNPITDDVVCSVMQGLEQREKKELAKKAKRIAKRTGVTRRVLSLSKIRKSADHGMTSFNAAHP